MFASLPAFYAALPFSFLPHLCVPFAVPSLKIFPAGGVRSIRLFADFPALLFYPFVASLLCHFAVFPFCRSMLRHSSVSSIIPEKRRFLKLLRAASLFFVHRCSAPIPAPQ